MKPDIIYRPSKPKPVLSAKAPEGIKSKSDRRGSAGSPGKRTPIPTKPKRKSRAPKAFNRDEYQVLYMRDRRAADAAGFGKGPNYKTVSQYREWKAERP